MTRKESFARKRTKGQLLRHIQMYMCMLSGVCACEVDWVLLICFFCRFDELRDLIRAQKNSMKIKDITKVQTGTSARELKLHCIYFGSAHVLYVILF